MEYGKYKNIRNAAWQCLIDYQITELPVKISEVAKKAGVSILKNSKAHELKENESGKAIFQNSRFYIVYNDFEILARCRFTIAHELAHIFLGHVLVDEVKYRTFEKRNEEEEAAEMFAVRLLAPACVLHELQVLTPEAIQRVCNISYTAAKIRAERMQILEKRNMYYSHPLERQVRQQFDEFIKKNRFPEYQSEKRQDEK